MARGSDTAICIIDKAQRRLTEMLVELETATDHHLDAEAVFNKAQADYTETGRKVDNLTSRILTAQTVLTSYLSGRCQIKAVEDAIKK